MSQARSPHPTLHEVLSQAAAGRGTPVARGGSSIVEGIHIQRFAHREGTYDLTPEQLLGIRVPIQRIRDGSIRGYQRVLKVWKARKVAQWMKANPDYKIEMQVVEVSIDGNGNAFYTDGQHRAAGAVIARLPLTVRVVKRSEEQARRLFANQGKATRPNRNVLIFDGEDPYSLYIQDAVTSPGEHSWGTLIAGSQSGASKTRMSATQAYGMLIVYVGRNMESVAQVSRNGNVPFDTEAANELAMLVNVFGTRQTNPLAWQAISLRAIATTAAAVFRNPEKSPKMPEDRERWLRLMPRFSFNSYAYIKSSTDLAERLVGYWNRNLPEERKVIL